MTLQPTDQHYRLPPAQRKELLRKIRETYAEYPPRRTEPTVRFAPEKSAPVPQWW